MGKHQDFFLKVAAIIHFNLNTSFTYRKSENKSLRNFMHYVFVLG